MKRTLYLTDRKRINIRLDGPSLLITSPETAERRIPLKILGRVVVFGSIMLDSEILTSLSSNNIPMLFISKKEKIFTISMNAYHAMTRGPVNLNKISKDKRKVIEFFEWLKSKKTFLEFQVLKGLCRSHITANANYKEIISFFMPDDRESWDTVKGIVRILSWSLIIEELLGKGLNPHHGIIHNRGAFGLVRDYAYIIRPEIDLQCLKFFRSDTLESLIESSRRYPHLEARCIGNIINRFENRQYIIKRLIHDINDKLFELLA